MQSIGARLLICLAAWAVVGTVRAADVTVALESFGALRAFRPGDVTGVRLRLTSSRPEPVECLVQWDLENADGDVVAHTRPVTLAPNQPVQRWLYARLPASNDATLTGQVFTVRVFEARDGVRSRELGSLRFGARDAEQGSQPVSMQEDLIALLASGRIGLDPLEATIDGGEVPSMNEVTRLATSVRVDDLPDRWEGLQGASVIVWAAETPQSLGSDRAAALLHWIERGGHLVIVLPETGDPWQLRGGSHPLTPILPRRGSVRAEGMAIEPLLPILSKGGSMRRSRFRMTATLFDTGAMDAGWRALISVPASALPRDVQARGLVVQRAWGQGRVTIVGLDLDALHRGAVISDGAPQADVFWNVVLGRRADAPSGSDYQNWKDADPSTLMAQGRAPVYDAGDAGLVRGLTGEVGRASSGVLAVIALFVAYWFAAVPGAWFVLRRRGKQAWAWPAVAGVALLVTPIAWLLGVAFGGGDVQVRHLTVADFVIPSAADPTDGPPRLVRANAWMSVSLGGFGTSEVAIDDAPGSRDLLTDWGGPQSESRRFPDTARTDRAIERSAILPSPARATTTDMQAWWLGSPAAWGRVAWQDEARPVTVLPPEGSAQRMALRGAIRHALPRPLRKVRVTFVMPFHFEARSWTKGPGSVIQPADPLPPCPVRMAALEGTWDGSPLDLGALLYPKGPEPAGALGDGSLVKEVQRYRDALNPLLEFRAARLASLANQNPLVWEDRIEMLSLFQLLQPPRYRQAPKAGPASARLPDEDVVRVHRSLGRELDLSGWFVRPCVIVTGVLDGEPCPVPMSIDGQAAVSDGSVFVRLILPLSAPDEGSVRAFRPSP